MTTEGPGRATSFEHVRHDPGLLDEYLKALVAGAVGGDAVALERLLAAISDGELAHPGIRRVLVNEADVDEVAQDVLVAVARGLDGFEGTSRVTTWLYSIARFKALDHVRRRRPQPVGDRPDVDALVGDAARISSMVATQASVQELLEQVPEPYRTAVRLRDLDGLPYEEIATATDAPINTVRSRISRGRALLAALVTAEGADLG
ncbi:MAG: RNA polymerase sigma factor [Actinomycetota bacterium]